MNGLTIARILGIRVQVHVSWILIAVLVLYTFWRGFSLEHVFWTEGQRWLAAGLTTFLFFGSVLAHELSHSLVARAFQLKVHSITLFVFGGVANLPREPDSPRAEVLMAAVGPAMSLALAGLFWGVSIAGAAVLVGRLQQIVVGVSTQLAFLNLLLAIFNMLPGFPLDGGRVLRGLVWGVGRSRRVATRIATRGGQLLALLLVAFGVAQLLNDLFIGGMWAILIALFLYNAAAGSYRQELMDDGLRRTTVGALMTRELSVVPYDLPLLALVQTFILPMRGRAFPVERGGEVVGLVAVEDVRRVRRAEWALRRVGDVMRPLSASEALRPDQDAAAAWEALIRGDSTVPVLEEGRVVGLLERDVVIDYLRTREELGLEGRR